MCLFVPINSGTSPADISVRDRDAIMFDSAHHNSGRAANTIWILQTCDYPALADSCYKIHLIPNWKAVHITHSQ